MSPATRGMARKVHPIQSGSRSMTAGAGAGTPAAATAFCTAAWGARSYSGKVATSGASRTTRPPWSGPRSTSTVSLARPPSAWTTDPTRGVGAAGSPVMAATNSGWAAIQRVSPSANAALSRRLSVTTYGR